MAIQASGAVSLSDIQTEFGGVNPISLSEYYRNGTYVPPGATSIPESGAIDLSDFYGADNQFAFNITSDTENADIRALAVTAGWDEATRLIANVNSGITLYSNSTSTGGAVVSGSFPAGITIVNSGNITGQGGGAQAAGGPALQITTSDTVKVTNNSGAFIAGGGGGGGGSQGGGGAGQALPGQAGAPGGSYTFSQGISSYTTVSCDGTPYTIPLSCVVTGSGVIGAGGRQGASAGSGNATLGNCTTSGTVSTPCGVLSSGNRTLIGGTGGLNPGGQGGSILEATNATVSGGGWGLAGASGGGAGGAAISGTYASLTDNGTVYGSV
jgi:hypothetical protein